MGFFSSSIKETTAMKQKKKMEDDEKCTYKIRQCEDDKKRERFILGFFLYLFNGLVMTHLSPFLSL